MVEPTNTGSQKRNWYLISLGTQLILLATFWSVDNSVIWILSGGIFFTAILYFLYRPKPLEFEHKAFEKPGSNNNPIESIFKELSPQAITKLVAIGVLIFVGFIFFLIIGLIANADNQSEIIEESKEWVKQSLENEPNNIEALTTTGNQFFESFEYDSALVYYERVLLIDPNNSAALYNKGLVFYRQAKYEASIAAFNQYIQLNPEVGSAYLMQGNNYYDRQIYDSAFDWYKKAYALGERDPFLTHALAWLYDQRQDLANAITFYKETLQLDSTRADIYLRLSELEPDNASSYKQLYEQWREQ